MSKAKKKLYALILSAAAVALIIDLLAGSGMDSKPASARAGGGGESARSAATATAGRSSADSATARLAASPFPRDLPPVDPPDRDIFGLTPPLQTALLPENGLDQLLSGPNAGGADDGREGSDQRMTAEQFRNAHTVSMTLLSENNPPSALVDGRWVKLGATLDGCELVEITGRTVGFDCHGQRVELTVGESKRSLAQPLSEGLSDLKPP